MLLNGSSRSSPPDFERSFETIFKHNYRPLLSYCRHMLGSREEAEDALQHAFIRAHRALRHGTAPRELRPWLYAIARNCCLSAIAARRAVAHLGDEALDRDGASLAGLAEEVRVREDLRELLAGIAKLPEDQRSALLLAELDDLSHREIAAVVGCPVSKVKALVYQARRALIADREARNASCLEIREQLSIARAGELRRGPLRRHLKLCPGCHEFQLAVASQRRSLALLLPVAPGSGLLASLLGHGAGHAVSAGAVTSGGSVTGVAGTSATGAGAVGAGAGAGTCATTGAGTMASAVAGTGAIGGAGAAGGAGAGTVAGAVASAPSAATGIGAGVTTGTVVGGGALAKLAIGGAVAVVAAAGAGVVATHRPRVVSPRQGPSRQGGDPRAATLSAQAALGAGIVLRSPSSAAGMSMPVAAGRGHSRTGGPGGKAGAGRAAEARTRGGDQPGWRATRRGALAPTIDRGERAVRPARREAAQPPASRPHAGGPSGVQGEDGRHARPVGPAHGRGAPSAERRRTRARATPVRQRHRSHARTAPPETKRRAPARSTERTRSTSTPEQASSRTRHARAHREAGRRSDRISTGRRETNSVGGTV